MPEDKFGEAQPIGKSSPETGSWTVSGATSADNPAPSDLSATGSAVSWPPPPPTIQYGSATPTMPPPFAPVGSTEKNWYGILSLVLGLAGGGLIGLGFGIAALNAVKEGRATNRTMAIWAIVLNCTMWILWLLLWFSFMSLVSDPIDDSYSGLDDSGFGSEPADFTAFPDLRVGDCVAEPDNTATELWGLDVVNCATPHWGQLYEIESLPAGEYPGDDQIEQIVDDACGSDDALADLAYDLPDNAYLYYYWPSSGSWVSGDRSYDCLVIADPGTLDQSYVG